MGLSLLLLGPDENSEPAVKGLHNPRAAETGDQFQFLAPPQVIKSNNDIMAF